VPWGYFHRDSSAPPPQQLEPQVASPPTKPQPSAVSLRPVALNRLAPKLKAHSVLSCAPGGTPSVTRQAPPPQHVSHRCLVQPPAKAPALPGPPTETSRPPVGVAASASRPIVYHQSGVTQPQQKHGASSPHALSAVRSDTRERAAGAPGTSPLCLHGVLLDKAGPAGSAPGRRFLIMEAHRCSLLHTKAYVLTASCRRDDSHR